MKSRFIVIDGKTYNSVNEMPDDVRRLYEQAMSTLKDQDGNRIPDAIEGSNPNLPTDQNRNGVPDLLENSGSVVSNTMQVVVDGRAYGSLADLPPDARARYDQAMGMLDANRNGIPDFVEGMMGGSIGSKQDQPAVSTSFTADTTRHAARPPISVSPTIEPDRPNGWLLALLAAFLFLGCLAVAAGIWYYFLR